MASASASSRSETTGAPKQAHAKLRGELAVNPQPSWLAAAIHVTVHGARGVAKAIAMALGKPYEHVTDLANPSARVALKAYEIPALVRATDCYAILDVLEHEVGRVAFRLPSPKPGMFDALHEGLGRTLRHVGSFVEKHGEAMKDGRVDVVELQELNTLIDQAIAGLCEYRELAILRASMDADREIARV
jgi:hypothetical protein